MSEKQTNNGIQVFGGKLKADQIAVGKSARATKNVYENVQAAKDISENASVTKVLLVFANPNNTALLRLGTEDRVIREAIRLSRYRDNIDLHVHHAATIHDLRRALLDEEFQIVHIAGHGKDEGLLLEDEEGDEYVVPQRALAELFGRHKKRLRCVVFNACYSISQGRLTSPGVAYTIAIEDALGDAAAIEFSRGFYDAIGAGKSIDFAYEEGCQTVKLAAPEFSFKSILLKGL